MAEWLLIWILTVEKFHGTIKDTQAMSQEMSTRTECLLEADVKLAELENQIGETYYLTSNFLSKAYVGGRITGVKVGCEQRSQ